MNKIEGHIPPMSNHPPVYPSIRRMKVNRYFCEKLGQNWGSAPRETTPIYTVFRARWITFFLVNRVENQNEPIRPPLQWPFGLVLVFNRPTVMEGTDYNGLSLFDKLRSCSSNCPIIQVLNNHCLPLS